MNELSDAYFLGSDCICLENQKNMSKRKVAWAKNCVAGSVGHNDENVMGSEGSETLAG